MPGNMVLPCQAGAFSFSLQLSRLTVHGAPATQFALPELELCALLLALLELCPPAPAPPVPLEELETAPAPPVLLDDAPPPPAPPADDALSNWRISAEHATTRQPTQIGTMSLPPTFELLLIISARDH